MTRHSLPLSLGVILMLFGCTGSTDPSLQVLGPTSLPFALPDVAYSHRLTAFGGGGEHTWTLVSGSGSLPAGLRLTTDGLISGIPTAVGISNFTVEVEGRDGQTAQAALSITVPPVLEPEERCADFPEYALPTFADDNLQRVVEAAVLAPSQEYLQCGQLPNLTTLLAASQAIESLVGIHNITPMVFLELGNNAITDLGPLSGLTSLTWLNLSNNSISDISALSGLGSLESLLLSNNSITDISAVAGLRKLHYLPLNNNPNLADIQPLLDNPATGLQLIGPGPEGVDLTSTSVSCGDVAALTAKGVIVDSDCP